jgi:hypothetical protein
MRWIKSTIIYYQIVYLPNHTKKAEMSQLGKNLECSEAKFLVPDWGVKVNSWHRDKVDSDMVLPVVHVLESTYI